MQSKNDLPEDERRTERKPGRPPRAALEDALDQALERLDHQVEHTRSYLAALDKQDPGGTVRRARKRDSGKPSGE